MRRRHTSLAALAAAVLLAPLAAGAGTATAAPAPGDDTPVLLTPKGEIAEEFSETEEAGDFAKLRDAYYRSRLLAGDDPLTIEQAAQQRAEALEASAALGAVTKRSALASVGGSWDSVGPDPIVQVGRTTNTLAGRVRADRSPRGPQGRHDHPRRRPGWGVDSTTTPAAPGRRRTDDADTQSVGALAIAPSNDDVVYLGSGEGALSGDSYYGDGVYRSTDGGQTWAARVRRLLHRAGVVRGHRGRPARRRTTCTSPRCAAAAATAAPPRRTATPYGVWESTDGGATWTLRKGTTDELHGATDLVMDPLEPEHPVGLVLGRRRSTAPPTAAGPGRARMGNLPEPATSLERRHPVLARHLAPGRRRTPTLYTGFDYFDPATALPPARSVCKTRTRASLEAPADRRAGDGHRTAILDYCGTQCFYDNVVKPDPDEPRHRLRRRAPTATTSRRSPAASTARTTVARTGRTSATTCTPTSTPSRSSPTTPSTSRSATTAACGSRPTGGGRLERGDPLVGRRLGEPQRPGRPEHRRRESTDRSARSPSSPRWPPCRCVPGQYWGGTQDNGTLRKSLANSRWFDQASGDGGQVIVDQTTPNTLNPNVPAYVFGTYFGISPVPLRPDGGRHVLRQRGHRRRHQPDRPRRVLRPVGAEPRQRQPDVPRHLPALPHRQRRGAERRLTCTWDADQRRPDQRLHRRGAQRRAGLPHLARSASPTAATASTSAPTRAGSRSARTPSRADSPTWHRRRHVERCPTGRSTRSRSTARNWRIAYAAYGGFSAATPGNTGHVFATTDGGRHWTNISGEPAGRPRQLASCSTRRTPRHALRRHRRRRRSSPPTAAHTGAASAAACPRSPCGSSTTTPSHGVLAAGTHGRGAYTLTDSARRGAGAGRLQGRRRRPGRPGQHHRTTRSRCATSATRDATGVHGHRPAARRTRRSCPPSDGGSSRRRRPCTWNGLTVPAGGSDRAALRRRASSTRRLRCTARSSTTASWSRPSGGFGTTGSPHTTPIAPAHAVVAGPGRQTGGGQGRHDGRRTTSAPDQRRLPRRQLRAGGQRRLGVHGPRRDLHHAADDHAEVAPGDSVDVCVKVDVPADGDRRRQTDVTTFTATSVGDPSVSAIGDDDHHRRRGRHAARRQRQQRARRRSPYYKDALTAAGVPYSYWDLAEPTPSCRRAYLTAHTNVVWFTGNSYPAPITPYESELAAFLDGGGRLLMSGPGHPRPGGRHDGLRPRLPAHRLGRHRDPERQGDRRRCTAVAGNPVTDGIGTVPLDHTRARTRRSRTRSPRSRPATPAFTDDVGRAGRPDGGRRRLQGGVPGLPVRGLRLGGPEGPADVEVAHLVRGAVTPGRAG